MFINFTKFFLLLLLNDCLHLSKCNNDDRPQVHIDDDKFKGSIVGKHFEDSNGDKYFGFRGIPYAKPPIKELRFRDPQKLDRVEGITIDATHDGYECNCVTARNASEDCLNLNVYTKQLKPSSSQPLLPVVVLIHPGGLYIGTGASIFMKPDHMMTQDLVLVTFNYRLGSLGFLNLGTADIPGNAGFKDQVFALRWVQRYIKHFGGNPKDVTLMGYSAGALSVHLHLVSTMSKDLFTKAIIMSGSMAPQTFLPQQQKYLAVRLAKRLKCPQFLAITEEMPYGVEGKFSNYEDIKDEDILQCLNQHNGSAIANTLRAMFDFPKDNPIYLWLPVIEKDFRQERFLAENFTTERKNVLIGYTSGELCLSAENILENDSAKRRFSNDFQIVAPRTFMYERHSQRGEITKKIKERYFNGTTEFSLRDYDWICDLFSDAIIRFGAHKLADFLAQNGGEVYFYEFSFVKGNSMKEKESDLKERQDRCEHMYDFQYLFNWPRRKHDSEREKKMVELYTGFVFDFAKNGKISDAKAKPYPQSYALINENIEFKQGRNFQNYEFWQDIFPNYFNYNLK